MENRDRDNEDRKGKKTFTASESKRDAVQKRHTLQQWQLMILVTSCIVTPQPSSELLANLAIATHLTYSQVQDWFRNRRYAKRQKICDSGESSTSAEFMNMIMQPSLWQGDMVVPLLPQYAPPPQGMEASGIGQGPNKDAQGATLEPSNNQGKRCSEDVEELSLPPSDEELPDTNQGCEDYPVKSPNNIDAE